jgi:RND family efflux transporter MFP subunit
MSRMKSVAILAVVGVLGAGGAWLHTSGKLPILKRPAAADKIVHDPASLAAAVSVVRVAPKDFEQTLLVTGTLVPREEILVGPEVEGLRIVEILVDEGDRVKKGQILARLVTDTLDAQLAQNAAAISKASASIAQAKSNISAAEARAVEATNTFERGKTLRQSGYVSEAIQDQREAAAKSAVAQVAAAKDALNLAEAEKQQVEALRKEIAWKRSRTEIPAPADGIVSRRIARVGGFAAGSGEPMFRLIAKGEIELDAEVTETQVSRVREGQPVAIDLPGNEPIPAKVRLVSPEIDKASRLGRIRISIGDNPALRIGAFARGTITVATSRGLAVPSSALQYTSTGAASVLVAKDNKVELRRVKIGLTEAGQVEIREGLNDGDLVVARSGTFLRDGDAVRPTIETKTNMTDASRGVSK